jgi:hypothetical protein
VTLLPGIKVFLLLFFQKKKILLFLKKKKQKDFWSWAAMAWGVPLALGGRGW